MPRLNWSIYHPGVGIIISSRFLPSWGLGLGIVYSCCYQADAQHSKAVARFGQVPDCKRQNAKAHKEHHL